MQVVVDILPEGSGYIHFLHIGIHEDELGPKLILVLSGPQYNLHDLVHHVSIDYEPEAKAKYCIISFNRIVRSNISVGNGGYCVYAPVQGIQILQGIVQRNYGRVSSGAVEPAN